MKQIPSGASYGTGGNLISSVSNMIPVKEENGKGMNCQNGHLNVAHESCNQACMSVGDKSLGINAVENKSKSEGSQVDTNRSTSPILVSPSMSRSIGQNSLYYAGIGSQQMSSSSISSSSSTNNNTNSNNSNVGGSSSSSSSNRENGSLLSMKHINQQKMISQLDSLQGITTHNRQVSPSQSSHPVSASAFQGSIDEVHQVNYETIDENMSPERKDRNPTLPRSHSSRPASFPEAVRTFPIGASGRGSIPSILCSSNSHHLLPSPSSSSESYREVKLPGSYSLPKTLNLNAFGPSEPGYSGRSPRNYDLPLIRDSLSASPQNRHIIGKGIGSIGSNNNINITNNSSSSISGSNNSIYLMTTTSATTNMDRIPGDYGRVNKMYPPFHPQGSPTAASNLISVERMLESSEATGNHVNHLNQSLLPGTGSMSRRVHSLNENEISPRSSLPSSGLSSNLSSSMSSSMNSGMDNLVMNSININNNNASSSDPRLSIQANFGRHRSSNNADIESSLSGSSKLSVDRQSSPYEVIKPWMNDEAYSSSQMDSLSKQLRLDSMVPSSEERSSDLRMSATLSPAADSSSLFDHPMTSINSPHSSFGDYNGAPSSIVNEILGSNSSVPREKQHMSNLTSSLVDMNAKPPVSPHGEGLNYDESFSFRRRNMYESSTGLLMSNVVPLTKRSPESVSPSTGINMQSPNSSISPTTSIHRSVLKQFPNDLSDFSGDNSPFDQHSYSRNPRVSSSMESFYGRSAPQLYSPISGGSSSSDGHSILLDPFSVNGSSGSAWYDSAVSMDAMNRGYLGVRKLPYDCRDYRNGNCSRGNQCKFRHAEKGQIRHEYVCRDFQRGKCSRSTCKFLHIFTDCNPIPRMESYRMTSMPMTNSEMHELQKLHGPMVYMNPMYPSGYPVDSTNMGVNPGNNSYQNMNASVRSPENNFENSDIQKRSSMAIRQIRSADGMSSDASSNTTNTSGSVATRGNYFPPEHFIPSNVEVKYPIPSHNNHILSSESHFAVTASETPFQRQTFVTPQPIVQSNLQPFDPQHQSSSDYVEAAPTRSSLQSHSTHHSNLDYRNTVLSNSPLVLQGKSSGSSPPSSLYPHYSSPVNSDGFVHHARMILTHPPPTQPPPPVPQSANSMYCSTLPHSTLSLSSRSSSDNFGSK